MRWALPFPRGLVLVLVCTSTLMYHGTIALPLSQTPSVSIGNPALYRRNGGLLAFVKLMNKTPKVKQPPPVPPRPSNLGSHPIQSPRTSHAPGSNTNPRVIVYNPLRQNTVGTSAPGQNTNAPPALPPKPEAYTKPQTQQSPPTPAPRQNTNTPLPASTQPSSRPSNHREKTLVENPGGNPPPASTQPSSRPSNHREKTLVENPGGNPPPLPPRSNTVGSPQNIVQTQQAGSSAGKSSKLPYVAAGVAGAGAGYMITS